jgi:hypothetical protein
VDALLIKVANFSESAVWVVGSLFVLEFVAVFYFVYRAGKPCKEEGRVVTEQMRGRSGRLIGWRYWSKRRVLASRSMYISEMSLVDGTATKAERLIAHGIKLAFLNSSGWHSSWASSLFCHLSRALRSACCSSCAALYTMALL